MPFRLIFSTFVLFSLLIPAKNFATHLRAGEITAERINCNSLTFRITVTVFLDTESGVRFGGNDDWLDFGDGEEYKILIPEQPTIARPDLGQNMGMASYSVIHTYTGYQKYTISYSEPNRNDHIVNIDRSVHTRFYVETAIYLDPSFFCNQNLPKLLVPPIDRACKGVAFFHNPGAYDLDGDSISFELAVPQQATDTYVLNYKDPNDARFYLNFDRGNEEQTAPPVFFINPEDGTLQWDAPGAIGEYNIAFHIVEWRKDRFGIWRKMSFVTRDMQIIVDDCDNERPDLIVPHDTCVTAGTVLEETILGVDAENDPVKIEVFSEVMHLPVSPATYAPNPAKFQPSSPSAQLHFSWRTQCEHVKDQYYQVVFKITDNPANGPKLVTFKTWRIKVVAPPPTWNNIKIDLVKRTATVQWQNYVCNNAVQMQVWRKIDGFQYSPANCETGMPEFLGYSLVGTVLLKDSAQPINQFEDTDLNKILAAGAKYCYRLVAIFPDPKGGESYVSKDTCLAPIRADAPVITHVTVEETHSSKGAIRISWRSPFEIDKSQFPGPYEYAIYRGNGLAGDDVTLVTSKRITDTTFVDSNIDTENQAYHYKIVLYSNNASDLLSWNAVDTSAVASSVWLTAKSAEDVIVLRWNAEVPWSNTSEKFPYHLVYRSVEAAPSNFILIDSVFITQNDFTYTDRGQYHNLGLDKNSTYCYRVLLRGVYGNPFIKEPLENFSQSDCVKLSNVVPPCAPMLTLAPTNCEEIFMSSKCQIKNFSNRLHWEPACDLEVKSYRVYAATEPVGEFLLLADNVTDTFYIDKNLLSFARCYRITSVDRKGIESQFSEARCNDNCPYFELPNVFTPNGDDCNEYFSAYGPLNPLTQNDGEGCALGNDNFAKCLRFVDAVSFRVFNRWGKEVYVFSTERGDKSTYINWNGKDQDGQPLSSGVYYYVANVTFDTIDPDKKIQIFKGWIHLLR